VFQRLRQEDLEIEASLATSQNPVQNKAKQKKQNKRGATWFFLVVYGKMKEERNKFKKKRGMTPSAEPWVQGTELQVQKVEQQPKGHRPKQQMTIIRSQNIDKLSLP
jgi:hypothetical protein